MSNTTDKFWDSYELIAILDRNNKNTKRIQFAKVKIEDNEGIDIREYYKPKDGEKFLPSKGLFIPYKYLEQFKNILNKI